MNARRLVFAVVALLLVTWSGRVPVRGAPTASEAVLRYLDATGRRDLLALRQGFTDGSSGRMLRGLLREHGGEDPRATSFVILESEPGLPGVPHVVVLTFRRGGTTGTYDLWVVERHHRRWLMMLEEPPPPQPCETGVEVCDADPG